MNEIVYPHLFSCSIGRDTCRCSLTHIFSFYDISTESCEFLIDLDPALKCIPLNATIKATYYGSEENRIEVEELLQSYIVNVMDVFNNSPEPIGGVFAAYFVGSRIQPEPLSTTRRGVDTNSSGFVILASGLAAVAIITMLFLYFFMARRRQKDEPNVLNTIEKREVLVPQAEESLRLPNLTMISDNSISTNQDNDVETPSNSKDRHTGSFAPPIVLLSGRTSSTDAMDSEDDDSHPNRQEDEIKRVSVLTPNKDEFKYMSTSTNENGPTVMVDANRPPKPPTISSTKALVPVSQPLKKRRKRRKKKKSPTIQRTKSRENIAGMETIDEGADEEATSGCNSVDDEDSEFSWYSSDSDPGSSRDPSPARSSREPSPARSTGSSGEASSAQAGVTKDGETVRNSRRLWI